MGASYTSESIESSAHQSAMAIRHGIMNSDVSYFEYLPEECRQILNDARESGDLPCDCERISSAIITKLRLNPSVDAYGYHDANDGLYNRLKSASFEANDISSLLELSETKNYTRARIRRAMWSIFFGVTSSDVKTLPAYTQILAMDKTGMLLLKNARKCDEFRILTKPSSFDDFTDLQKKQKQISDWSDSVFELTKPQPKSGRSALKFTPYIKK
jgi:predicted nucleotidyltransferase